MKKPENPAKLFLRRYIALTGRIDALQKAIDEAMERAFSTSVTLKEVIVKNSPAEHDPMARDVCNAVDACEILYQHKMAATIALQEILTAVDSLTDERQKELITLRYILGLNFPEIVEKMHYSETRVFVIHGRALIEINKWLERRKHDESANKTV